MGPGTARAVQACVGASSSSSAQRWNMRPRMLCLGCMLRYGFAMSRGGREAETLLTVSHTLSGRCDRPAGVCEPADCQLHPDEWRLQ